MRTQIEKIQPGTKELVYNVFGALASLRILFIVPCLDKLVYRPYIDKIVLYDENMAEQIDVTQSFLERIVEFASRGNEIKENAVTRTYSNKTQKITITIEPILKP
jgi:hypothetical protein